MSAQTSIEPVTKTIVVEAAPERAFAVFTEGWNTWWPNETHSVAPQPATTVLELREGGRAYDRGGDGSECDWGRVLAYEPPTRFVLAWHLDADFSYDPDPARASEVEVAFAPEGDGTRVALVHRGLERHGDENGAQLREVVASDGGWPTLLDLYARSAGSTSAP